MRKAQFIVTVEFDEAAIEHESARRNRTIDAIRAEVLADVECRLFDSIRHRDAVERVGVELVEPRASEAQ